MRQRIVSSILFAGLALMAATPTAALEKIGEGIYRIDWKMIDNLLTIESFPELNVLVLEDNEVKSISDAHMKLVRQWVESGGVFWVAGDGLDNPLAQAIAPFRSESFDFVRSSSGNRGGELIVRGLSPRMLISDHTFTAGVNQLYLYARSKFDGTDRAEPLVQMGDTEGHSGWVMVAIPVGKGFMILDGTARENHGLFRRLKGFDEAHPNGLKQDKIWNSYDWDQVRINARDYARRTLPGNEASQPTGN